MENLLNALKDNMALPIIEADRLSPLVLAYIGDSVYDLVVKMTVISDGNAPVNKLHLRTSMYVKAVSQAVIIRAITDQLTEDEVRIFKRGRNAKFYTKPKNVSVQEYNAATGFEALLGYLFLKGNYNRLIYIISEGMKHVQE